MALCPREPESLYIPFAKWDVPWAAACLSQEAQSPCWSSTGSLSKQMDVVGEDARSAVYVLSDF